MLDLGDAHSLGAGGDGSTRLSGRCEYVALLPGRIAEAIARAALNLEPARIGWSVIDDPAHTFCRRWIRRPDKMIDDPFGERTVRANMHPGYQNPDVIGPVRPGRPCSDGSLDPVA